MSRLCKSCWGTSVYLARYLTDKIAVFILCYNWEAKLFGTYIFKAIHYHKEIQNNCLDYHILLWLRIPPASLEFYKFFKINTTLGYLKANLYHSGMHVLKKKKEKYLVCSALMSFNPRYQWYSHPSIISCQDLVNCHQAVAEWPTIK